MNIYHQCLTAGIQNARFSTTSQTYLADTENPIGLINLFIARICISHTGEPLCEKPQLFIEVEYYDSCNPIQGRY